MTFSIITIAYNSEKTIERTIKSVLAQTNKDYEYIIIDGASNDSTLDIVKKYEPLFQGRMKWISEPDKGIYNAMNKGIRKAEGKIIGIVNSDDWLEKDALSILNETLQQDSANFDKLLTGEMLFHYRDGKKQLYATSLERYEYYSKRYRMGLNHPATFVPKSIYDKIGLFDEQFKLYADADFILKCYETKIGVVFINRILTNMSDCGASNNRSEQMLHEAILKVKIHAKTRTDRWLNIAECYLRWWIKGLVPEWYVKRYRLNHN